MKPKQFKPSFNDQGMSIKGKFVNSHAKDLPKDYVTWCSQNVDGWRLQYEAALSGQPIPKPKVLPRPKGESPRVAPLMSVQGNKAGSIKNAGFDKPGKKKFTWRSTR